MGRKETEMDALFIQFDHRLVQSHPTLLDSLSKFYCNTWRFDPNFAEYKQCPCCEHYYSFNFVQSGNTICPDCQIELVEAWNEEEVKQTILNLTAKGSDFFGAVALTPDTSGTIIGFVWGYNKPLSEIEDQTVLSAVYNSAGYTPYFNEIATDPSFRCKGLGSQLCRMLVSWMQNTSPNVPGYLHTHAASPARRLFERAGYRYLCDDTKLGGGRIYMAVPRCGEFTPSNL